MVLILLIHSLFQDFEWSSQLFKVKLNSKLECWLDYISNLALWHRHVRICKEFDTLLKILAFSLFSNISLY